MPAHRELIELPWPPSVNRYWRTVPLPGRRSGPGYRVVLSREGRTYRDSACARLSARGGPGPLTGRLAVRVELRPPTRRALDIDNRMKALLDAMQHARVYADDGQIDRLLVERGKPVAGGAARVEIVELQPGDAAPACS